MSKVLQTGWINVGPNGAFTASGQAASTPSDIAELATALVGHKRRKLVLYFHGGLVGERLGLEQAGFWLKTYEPTTTLNVSIVWETGAVEIIAARLATLHNSKAFKKFLAWVLEKIAERGGGGKGLGGPSQAVIEGKLETSEGVSELDAMFEAGTVGVAKGGPAGLHGLSDAEQQEMADELLAGWSEDPAFEQALYENNDGAEALRNAAEGDDAKGLDLVALAWVAVRVVAMTIARRLRGTDHGIYPTAVEETLRALYLDRIGAGLWTGMKNVARDMWIDDGPNPGLNGHVGGYLLRQLIEVQKQDPAFRIDLVGHSAGSIAICHMLETIRAKKLPLRVESVTFLAPAVRFDLFKAAIVRAEAKPRFRMFTMTDAAEQADKLVSFLYPRSLLYFISGVLEKETDAPLAGMQRHLKGPTETADAEFDEVRDWLNEPGRHRVIYSPTKGAVAPFACGAKSHGDFDNDAEAVASILKLADLAP